MSVFWTLFLDWADVFFHFFPSVFVSSLKFFPTMIKLRSTVDVLIVNFSKFVSSDSSLELLHALNSRPVIGLLLFFPFFAQLQNVLLNLFGFLSWSSHLFPLLLLNLYGNVLETLMVHFFGFQFFVFLVLLELFHFFCSFLEFLVVLFVILVKGTFTLLAFFFESFASFLLLFNFGLDAHDGFSALWKVSEVNLLSLNVSVKPM